MHKHRIRCVGIVLQDDKILMVLHKHLKEEKYWLMPPGGGLLEGETLYEGAVREVFEETRLETEPVRIIYVRQFLEDERNYQNLEVYVLLRRLGGVLKRGTDPEETVQYIQSAGFYNRQELEDSQLTIHPAILLDQFWQDARDEFPVDRLYLGMTTIEEEKR